MSAEIRITLVRSHIGASAKQKSVLGGLGLTKMNKSVVLNSSPEVMGMINKVSHMIKIEK
ncbi:MAG: 50S ribosomal protein L30 [Desulfuromonadales bacterium]|nr:MAG: 50S ribosomal protein L30 [Desulfuromonadales bacterium]